MILHAAGLAWQCESPSYYRLAPCHVVRGAGSIEVCFLGDCWALFLARGTDIECRMLTGRDEGLELVAQAFEFN